MNQWSVSAGELNAPIRSTVVSSLLRLYKLGKRTAPSDTATAAMAMLSLLFNAVLALLISMHMITDHLIPFPTDDIQLPFAQSAHFCRSLTFSLYFSILCL